MKVELESRSCTNKGCRRTFRVLVGSKQTICSNSCLTGYTGGYGAPAKKAPRTAAGAPVAEAAGDASMDPAISESVEESMDAAINDDSLVDTPEVEDAHA